MLKRLMLAAILTLLAAAARGECAPGSLIVVVNKANPTDSLSMAQLRKLMLGDVRGWPDHKPVTLVSRDFSSKAFECALAAVVRQTVPDYRRYVMNAEFRGEETISIQVAPTALSAAKLVANSQGAIAVIESDAQSAVSNSVKVVKVNGNAPGESGYPL